MNEIKQEVPSKVSTRIRYKYIPKRVFGVENKNHVLYDGKLDSSIDKFCVLRDATSQFVAKWTVEEEKFIREGLSLSESDLNLNNRKNTYLSSIEIEMPKYGLILDISKPYDLLVDRILLAWDNIIAPNAKAVAHKKSYRYVRIDDNEETTSILSDGDIKKKFYKLLGQLETSREKMIMYLLGTNTRILPGADTATVRRMTNQMAERDMSQFIDTMEDPLFVEKGLLNMAVILKIKDLDTSTGLFMYKQKYLAFEGEAASLSNAAKFLKDKANNIIKKELGNLVLDEFNRVK